MNMTHLNKKTTNIYFLLCQRLLLVYLMYFVCRMVFFAYNYSTLGINSLDTFLQILKGGLVFDTSGILYVNIIVMIMHLLPIRSRSKAGYQLATKWVYFLLNIPFFILNLGDTIYFQFTGKRTSLVLFKEFENEDPTSFLYFFVEYWHLTLIGLVLIALWFILYPNGKALQNVTGKLKAKIFYPLSTLVMALALGLSVVGIRGGFSPAIVPIRPADALAYTENSVQAAMVLNTPFVMIRLGKVKEFPELKYMTDEEAIALFNSIRHKSETKRSPYFGIFKGRNVVFLIWESCSKEWVGSLNKDIKDYKGFTPFLDSLIEQSYCFENAYANGTKSIDAMPAAFASVLKPIHPLVTTDYATNHLQSSIKLFKGENYHTAYFHNATRGSMGFDAMSKHLGFDAYYGREEFGNDDEFDGKWGIWDEPFLQFVAEELNTIQEPFFISEFTTTSHPPYKVPEAYEERYPREVWPYHHVIRYTDHALEEFFKKAKEQKWYENTVFVLMADHSVSPYLEEYKNSVRGFQIPILFFDPQGKLKGRDKTIVQQADLPATLLDLFGIEADMVSFGHNMFNPEEEHYAINMVNYAFQLVKGDYALQYDGKEVLSFYNYREDPKLEKNLVHEDIAEKGSMTKLLQSILQQYSYRIRNDKLSLE